MKSESEVAQLCLTLHHLMDCSLPGSSVHGISQAAKVLQWGAIAFSIYISYIHVFLIFNIDHSLSKWKLSSSSSTPDESVSLEKENFSKSHHLELQDSTSL